MWWAEAAIAEARTCSVRRPAARIALALLTVLALGGCIRPLYAPTTMAVDGSHVRAALSAIEVPMIPDRLGHTMRNELVFLLEGRDNPGPKRYRLLVSTNESVAAALVNSQFQRADNGSVNGSATYQLVAIDNPAKVLASGNVTGFASFENTTQRFANLRAIREAQQRLARHLAEQVHLQLAAKLTSAAL